MEKIPWYQSAIIRQQIIALLVALLGITGLGAKLGAEFDVEKIVVGVFSFAALIIPAWTIVTRLFKANPPLTDTAAQKEVVKQEELKNSAAISTTGSKTQGGFAHVSLLMVVAGALVVGSAIAIAGCVTAANPVKAAETKEQKAYALYGTFVVNEEAAADFIVKEGVPENVKAAIRAADAKAKPLADSLVDAAQAVLTIRLEVEAGKSTKEKLLIAIVNLDRYITEASPPIRALVAAVKEAT